MSAQAAAMTAEDIVRQGGAAANRPIEGEAAVRAAIEFKNVTCRFETPQGDYTATEHVSFHVQAGEFVSVVGPTGCGKSTILNMAAGLLPVSEGEVRIFGEKLSGLNRRAGYMFQAESLMPWATAIDNVAMPLFYRGVPKREAHERAMAWLERVGLAAFPNRYPHELSGGMRKRVAMAQTLVADPDILLMDESFSALDVQTRELMENELLAIWEKEKKAVLFITHDLDEAVSMSDRVVVMSAGPASHPVGNFVIDLPRPRDLIEIRMDRAFLQQRAEIWSVLRDEVMKSYRDHRSAMLSPGAAEAAAGGPQAEGPGAGGMDD